MSIDAFLELLNESGQAAVKGECLDAAFGNAHALQLVDFELTAQGDLDSAYARELDEDSDKETQAKKQKKARVSLFTFTVTKEIDAATPFLFQAFCRRWSNAADPKGKFAKARVTVRKAGGAPLVYLKYEFTDVWMYSWELSNKDGDDLPEETIEFCARTYAMQYFPQSNTGVAVRSKPFMAGWDFKEGKEVQM